MGFHMLLYSLPKIEGLELKEIIALDSCMKIQERNESSDEPGISSTLLTEVAYWAKDYGLHFLFLDHFQLVDDYLPYYKITKEQLQDCYTAFLNGRQLRPDLANINQSSPPIDRTRNILETLLLNFNFETHYLVYVAG